MENLFMAFEHLAETITTKACRPSELRHLAKKLDVNLSRQLAMDLRQKHLKVFMERIEDELRQMCATHELDKRFEELSTLEEICAKKYGAESKGYRPVGDPVFDSEGILSKIKSEYKKSLERLVADLDEQIRENAQVIENNSTVMKKVYDAVEENFSRNDSVMSVKSAIDD